MATVSSRRRGGKPQAISPEIDLPGFSDTQIVSRDGRYVWARAPDQRYWAYSLNGGKPNLVSGMTADDVWANWGADSSHVYIYQNGFPVKVFLLDSVRGTRTLVAEFLPSDPVGLEGAVGVRMTPNGKSAVYTYTRALSQLYLLRDVN
jgi:hypothetical protein